MPYFPHSTSTHKTYNYPSGPLHYRHLGKDDIPHPLHYLIHTLMVQLNIEGSMAEVRQSKGLSTTQSLTNTTAHSNAILQMIWSTPQMHNHQDWFQVRQTIPSLTSNKFSLSNRAFPTLSRVVTAVSYLKLLQGSMQPSQVLWVLYTTSPEVFLLHVDKDMQFVPTFGKKWLNVHRQS